MRRLNDLGDTRALLLAEQLQTNHSRKGFFSKIFSISLSSQQKTDLKKLSGSTIIAITPDKDRESRIAHKQRTEIKSKLENRKDIALGEFRVFVNRIKSQLTPKNKQELVKQFMYDPEKLKIVLNVCSKSELRESGLLEKLSIQYPSTTNIELATIIAKLPEFSDRQSWQQHPSTIEQHREKIKPPEEPQSVKIKPPEQIKFIL